MNTTVLLSLLFISPSVAPPDLCDDGLLNSSGTERVDSRGQNLPVHCQWTGPDAPVWDDEVCCDLDSAGSACTLERSRDGSCQVGSVYYCEHGEPTSTGGFVCYQPYPSMCDAGLCVEAPTSAPPVVAVTPLISCCNAEGVCVWVGYNTTDCEGELSYCHWAMTLLDGTVECFE